jgi:hypothetical protein
MITLRRGFIMKHLHEKSGKSFEIGRLIDPDGGTYDINVITKWDEENDYDKSPIIIDYYFGDYDKEVTDDYIDMYLEKQKTMKQVLMYLEGKLTVDEDFMDSEDINKLNQTIESVKEMITDWF